MVNDLVIVRPRTVKNVKDHTSARLPAELAYISNTYTYRLLADFVNLVSLRGHLLVLGTACGAAVTDGNRRRFRIDTEVRCVGAHPPFWSFEPARVKPN